MRRPQTITLVLLGCGTALAAGGGALWYGTRPAEPDACRAARLQGLPDAEQVCLAAAGNATASATGSTGGGGGSGGGSGSRWSFFGGSGSGGSSASTVSRGGFGAAGHAAGS